jgi:hypothetical protein
MFQITQVVKNPPHMLKDISGKKNKSRSDLRIYVGKNVDPLINIYTKCLVESLIADPLLFSLMLTTSLRWLRYVLSVYKLAEHLWISH